MDINSPCPKETYTKKLVLKEVSSNTSLFRRKYQVNPEET
ncbi:Uncharacterised protein [Streptococcus pseudoporcinus]|uniref:Uncharacterized protein n=1 Tax=Streptococcus pseudoporcinus TaxID=361101 RepID=A0A4U9YJN7_9STRE|nr:Uncharacterised protein [Streptococcus pseudoporcinus]